MSTVGEVELIGLGLASRGEHRVVVRVDVDLASVAGSRAPVADRASPTPRTEAGSAAPAERDGVAGRAGNGPRSGFDRERIDGEPAGDGGANRDRLDDRL